MYITTENMISLLTIFGAVVGFIGYRCGKSDQRDADTRAAITRKCEDYRKAVRGTHGD